MVSNVLVQSRIDRGRGIAAARIGSPFTLYRALSATNPLAIGNSRGTVMALLDSGFGASFKRPNLYADPVWQAIMDASVTLPGDYLSNGNDTYFLAAIQALLPVAVVACNRVISILRPAGNAGVGAQPYGGDVVGSEMPLMTSWPASVLNGTKGERGDVALPGDIRMPWVAILLPAFPGVTLKTADVVTDDLGRRFKLSACELSDLGWRCTAAMEMSC
jgi:hypothetical protein